MYLVFSTRGKIPVYSPKGLANVPKLEKSESMRYKAEYADRGTRYNAAGSNFNWYDISQLWHNSLIDNTYRYHGDCGGFSNCGNSKSVKSKCAGISASCITTEQKFSGNATHMSGCITTSSNNHSSSSGGGSSSCGGSSSSCGGSSSSCGGSSSSCGGGGGGSSCGGG